MSSIDEDVLIWERKDYNTLIKESDTDLGTNAASWMNEIRSAFERQHPEFIEIGAHPSITFENKDFMSGNALGAITITVNSNYVVFPVIVRGGILKPFDSAYVRKRWRFMDKDIKNNLIQDYDIFEGVVEKDDYIKRKERQGRWNHINNTYSSKLSSLISPRLVDDGDREKLARLIRNNAEEYAHAKWPFKSLMGMLSKEAKSKSDNDALRAGDYDVIQLTCDDINEYSIKLATRGCNGYVEKVCGYQEAKKELEKFTKEADKILNTAENHPQESVLIEKGPTVEPTIPSEPYPRSGMISGYDTYRVLTEDGDEDVGVVYPLIDWQFKATKKYLYLSNEYWAVQENMAGKPHSRSFIPPKGQLNTLAEGAFVYEKSGRAFATPPFKISSIMTSDEGISIKAIDLITLQKIHMLIVPSIRAIMKIDPEEHPDVYIPEHINLYIPSEMRFTPLPENRTHIIKDPQSVMKLSNLQAEATRYGDVVKAARQASGKYLIDCNDYGWVDVPARISTRDDFNRFDKIATYNQSDAAFMMAVLGADKAGLKKLGSYPEPIYTKHPSSGTCAYRHILENTISTELEKTSSKMGAEYDAVIDAVPKNALFKIAARLDELETLDQVFSLDLMDKKNITYFVSRTDLLDDVESLLVKLLIATRLSSTGINEDDILDALQGISAVQSRLKGLALKINL